MPCSQDTTSAEKNQSVPLSVYQAEMALERQIQTILREPSIRKREKIKRLRFLKENSSNPRSQSHIQYYLDDFKEKRQDHILSALSIFIVGLFFLYAIGRLIQNF